MALVMFLRGQAAVPSPHGDQSAPPVGSQVSIETMSPDHAGSTEGVEAQIHALTASAVDEGTDPQALLRLARLQHDGHDPDAAADTYERYLELRPEDRQVWLDLANALAAAGRWGDALSASQRLLQIVPDDPAALYNLGAVQATLGRIDEAKTAWHAVMAGPDPDLARLAVESLERLRAESPGQ